MITPIPEIKQILQDLNATFRFIHVGPIYEPNPNDDTKTKQVKPGCVRCEIIDLTLRAGYHTAEGGDEASALEAAARGAIDAEKPQTPAQRNSAHLRVSNQLAIENENLRKRLAELEAKITEPPAKRPYNRKPKEPVPQ